MERKPDEFAVSEECWKQAVAREAVMRSLAVKARLTPAEIVTACRHLGLNRTRFYELLGQYWTAPVTSSLLNNHRGPEKGSRRLAEG